MPASLKRALADSFALGHPDIPWQLPADLPSARDLRDGLRTLEGQLLPVDRKHASFCLAKLASGFNERLTREEAAIRLEVWLEACGDIPADLWSTATVDLLRSWRRDDHFGRVPEAADLRKAVQDKLDLRSRQIARCKAMLAKAGDGPKTDDYQREPEEQRLRATIWRGWEFRVGIRQGFLADKSWSWAQRDERRLAEIENREPADWARIDGPAKVVQVDAPKVESAAARRTREFLAEKARAFRGGPGSVVRPDRTPAAEPIDDYGHLASG